MTPRFAPAVAYPVGRTRLVGALLFALAALAVMCALCFAALQWPATDPPPVLRVGLVLTCAALASAGVWAQWRASLCGWLRFEAGAFGFAAVNGATENTATPPAEFESVAELRVLWDAGHTVLLAMRLHRGGKTVWHPVGAEERAAPTAWLDFRRAVYSRARAGGNAPAA